MELDFVKEMVIEMTMKKNEEINERKKFTTIHELFEAQVESNPMDIALVFNNKSITYEELNDKSNKIARLLKQKHIIKDKTVGVVCDRSIELIISILAILKSGAAFLPIDPEFPKERIEFMLHDSKTDIILTNQEAYLQKLEHCDAINVSSEEHYIGEDSTNLGALNIPENMAYLIYTSGSTGKPKGVVIEHKSVVNLFHGITKIIDFSKGKRILALTTISFDIFVLEILLPLVNGLTVVLADESSQKNPKLLSKMITDNKIDMLQMTPSRMQLLISHDKELKCLGNLKEIMIGGEAYPKSLLEKLSSLSNIKIYNMYGPTETTVWSTVSDLTNKKSIDIGKPILNTQIYIIDGNNDLVLEGIEGEICLGGHGLARGYLNRPELTAEKFISNPFVPGERMYKTGDLGRLLPDGTIECLGRIDDQVKIRGHRIELGEIETTLLKYKSVKQAAVTAFQGKENINYLCAYYVSDEEMLSENLRDYLNSNLPQYMIPAYFVRLDNMPQTPNGKTDKRSLPNPESILNFEEKQKVDEKSDTSDLCFKIREIIERSLDVPISMDNINLNSNLVDLGVSSIIFIKIVVSIEEEFGFEFGDDDMDTNKFLTVKSFVEYVENRSLLK